MSQTLTETIEYAVAELRGYLDDPTTAWTEDRDDLIRSLADSHVPIHTETLLQLALDNFYLATAQPEFMAFDGENTAVNAIAGNVYEEIYTALSEECTRFDEENADEEEEDEEEQA